MPRERSPSSCPACGGSRVFPILWGWRFFSPEHKADLEAGRVILGSRHQSGIRAGRPVPRGHPEVLGAPDWACIDCEPGWAEVHQLALEEEKLQDAKDEAVRSSDFESAAAFLDRQDEINDKIVLKVRQLTSPAQPKSEPGE
jgi:hypothetical protein